MLLDYFRANLLLYPKEKDPSNFTSSLLDNDHLTYSQASQTIAAVGFFCCPNILLYVSHKQFLAQFKNAKRQQNHLLASRYSTSRSSLNAFKGQVKKATCQPRFGCKKGEEKITMITDLRWPQTAGCPLPKSPCRAEIRRLASSCWVAFDEGQCLYFMKQHKKYGQVL